MEFLLGILCALTTLSRCSQCMSAHNACTAHNECNALSWRSHCVDGMLKTQRHLKVHHTTIFMQTPWLTTAFAQRPLCVPAEFLLHCRRPYRMAMATLRRLYCAFIRTLSHGICFEHAQNVRCHSTFHEIPQHLLAMLLCCSRDAWDHTACNSASCIFLGCYGSP